ncbi:MAG TPA: LptE family protein [Candidatus Omnitrophota bacterium]|nr:LptE family protein [Candidatus Omnitrophota bacterium]HPN87823.1 LptE family protein [Candidatus Omnitrophota bacterium]
MKKKFSFLLFVVWIMLVQGCGYTLSSTLPSRLNTIHITLFKNAIDFSEANKRNLYFPMLEVDVKNALSDEFLFNGRLKIADEDTADLVLKGELRNYQRQALRYTDNNDVQEYRVLITVSLQLWDNTHEKNMWTESAFVGQATYFVTGAQATTEESAVQEAIKDLAKRVVERTVEYW